VRRILFLVVGAVCALGCVGVSSASASSPIQLVLSQGAAFSLLGHSCGGIQEESFATGFAVNGYPQGNVYMQTRCGGSGRGGGYKTTTYSAWAAVVWTWYGETRSFSRLEGSGATEAGFEATDAHGDRIYDSGTRAYLEPGEPPYQAPAPPTGVSPSVSLYEVGETEYLRMTVYWTLDPETAGLISSNTVTATPTKPGPPVLTATTSNGWTPAYLGPVEPNTAYDVTVTSTDAEGTSEPSAPVEIKSPNSDGEAEKEKPGGESHEVACESNTGTIKLSPGLSETPHVQNITVKGRLSQCDGKAGVESATYVAHLKTIGEVTCAALSSFSTEPTTEAVSLSVKWAPQELGASHGSLVLPVTEASSAALTGTLEGGPFGGPQPITGGEVFEAFTGGPECGIPQGKKKAKAVKNGTFSGTALEVE
jgi:hypothetical protein